MPFLLVLAFAIMIAPPVAAAPGDCRAIDGDTLDCRGERIRLENADAPEMRARCKAEFNAARAAQRFSQAALDGAREVEIRAFTRRPRDRHWRTLANVYVDGRDLGKLLIEAGLAREYHGERRMGWC